MAVDLTYFWKKKTLLSFIAVFFVVVIHSSATELYAATGPVATLALGIRNFLAYDLGAVAVPLFFFLAGFTLFRNFSFKRYGQKMRSRAKSLLVPYLFWNIFGMLVIILCTFTPLSGLIAGRELFEPTVENFLEGVLLHKYNFQFWFMYDLIIYVALTPIIYLLIRYKPIGVLAVVLALVLPAFADSWAFSNLNFTIFYLLGCLAGKHCLSYFAGLKSRSFAAWSSLLAIIILAIRFLAIYGIISLPVIVTQLLLVLLLISLWFGADLLVPKLKSKKYWGEFFPIYTLHAYFLAVLVKLIYFVLPESTGAMLVNELSAPLITMLLVTTLTYWWRQKLPKSYSLLFGERKN